MFTPETTLSSDALLLFPRPQRLHPRPGRVRFAPVVQLRWEMHEGPEVSTAPALSWLTQALHARGHRLDLVGSRQDLASASMRVRSLPADRLPPEAASALQSYALEIDATGITLFVTSEPGLQHALATLVQLITVEASRARSATPEPLTLPHLVIEDWPDFAQRGVLLDISRDKVPTLDTLKALVDELARWKINQLQLYMEHTFAYPGHEIVWQHASALTGEEIRELDAYCAARHVELVPNQNSFGHMHRWLVHAPYRALAECPEGFAHPWNWSGEPYGLCATDPASLRFLEGLYDQLLPHFRSGQFNVGLDETLDLGFGRSRAACEARGTERVYLEFLREVHARVRARGKVMQFWGDIIVKRPDLIGELPRDAIALEWGYEADHPFAEHLARFRDAGLDFYVCPGTSSWNSIAGRTDNALLNLARAAREGKAAGASGMLTTDWGDHGHLQPLAVSYLGLFAGAGFSWNVADAQDPLALDLPRLLDLHVFSDSAFVLGRAAYELGNTYRHAGSLRPNASVLFWILIKPERLFEPPGVTRASLEQALAHLEQAGEPLARARPQQGQLICEEFAWARDLLRFACHLGIARSTLADRDDVATIPAPVRADLTRALRPLLERHRALWRARNRPGGLEDSARRLEQVLQGGRSIQA